MHPMDADLVARCHREDLHRAAQEWRANRGDGTPRPLRAAVGRRLVAAGQHLQAPSPHRRPGLGQAT